MNKKKLIEEIQREICQEEKDGFHEGWNKGVNWSIEIIKSYSNVDIIIDRLEEEICDNEDNTFNNGWNKSLKWVIEVIKK